jgi:hypothetical protein
MHHTNQRFSSASANADSLLFPSFLPLSLSLSLSLSLPSHPTRCSHYLAVIIVASAVAVLGGVRNVNRNLSTLESSTQILFSPSQIGRERGRESGTDMAPLIPPVQPLFFYLIPPPPPPPPSSSNRPIDHQRRCYINVKNIRRQTNGRGGGREGGRRRRGKYSQL